MPHQLMLRTVEAAHVSVTLRPVDDQIKGDKAEFRRSRMNARGSRPVDEAAAAVAEIGEDDRDPRVSLKARNSASVISPEATQIRDAATRDMPSDLRVVELVGQDETGGASPPNNRARTAGSVASPQTMRCGPSWKISPILATVVAGSGLQPPPLQPLVRE